MIAAITRKLAPWMAWIRLAVLAAVFAAGWVANGWRCDATIAAMKTAQETAQKNALAATISAYETAQNAAARESAALEGRLAAQEHLNRTLTRRHAHETRKDAYRCPLPADGNRLFNEGRAAVPVPDAAGEPDR